MSRSMGMDQAIASQTRRLWFGLGISLLIFSTILLVVLPTVVSLNVLSLETDVLYMICGLFGALFVLSVFLVYKNHKKSKYEMI